MMYSDLERIRQGKFSRSLGIKSKEKNWNYSTNSMKSVNLISFFLLYELLLLTI